MIRFRTLMWGTDILRGHLGVKAAALLHSKRPKLCFWNSPCLPSFRRHLSILRTSRWDCLSGNQRLPIAEACFIHSCLGEALKGLRARQNAGQPVCFAVASLLPSTWGVLEFWSLEKKSNTIIKLSLMTQILHATYLRSSRIHHVPHSL